jgi:hypothetical protein
MQKCLRRKGRRRRPGKGVRRWRFLDAWRKSHHHHHHRGEAEGKCTVCGAPHLIPNLDFVKNSVTSERASERASERCFLQVWLCLLWRWWNRGRGEGRNLAESLSLSWCNRRVCFSGIIIVLRLCVLMRSFVCCCYLHTVTGFFFCFPPFGLLSKLLDKQASTWKHGRAECVQRNISWRGYV